MPNPFLTGLRIHQLVEMLVNIKKNLIGEYDLETRGKMKNGQAEVEAEIKRRVLYLQSSEGHEDVAAWIFEDGLPVKIKGIKGFHGKIVGAAVSPDGESMIEVRLSGLNFSKAYWPHELTIGGQMG